MVSYLEKLSETVGQEGHSHGQLAGATVWNRKEFSLCICILSSQLFSAYTLSLWIVIENFHASTGILLCWLNIRGAFCRKLDTFIEYAKKVLPQTRMSKIWPTCWKVMLLAKKYFTDLRKQFGPKKLYRQKKIVTWGGSSVDGTHNTDKYPQNHRPDL